MYVQVYTVTYRETARGIQTRAATLGCVTYLVIYSAMVLTVLQLNPNTL